MSRSNWREDANGIMVFDPTRPHTDDASPQAAILSTEADPRNSYQQGSDDTLLDQRQSHQHIRIYIDLTGEDEDISSRTASPIPNPTIPALSSSRVASSPQDTSVPLSKEQLFDEQLSFYASKARSSTPSTPASSVNGEPDHEYESDGTNFQSSTPCPRREKRPATQRSSQHYFRNVHMRKSAQSGPTASQSRQQERFKMTPSKAKSLDDKLREAERTPPRKWSFAERELLVCLNRWFEPPGSIPSVFRFITGTDRSDTAIKTQWDGHCLVFGPKAIPEYAQVFKTPFENPGAHYLRIMQMIEQKTHEAGVELRRRGSDVEFDTNKAERSKSGSIRRTYKNLCRRHAYTTPVSGTPSFQATRVGGMPISVDDDEMEVDSEVQDLALLERCVPAPHLGFRIWSDTESFTLFDAKLGFVAKALASWNPPFLPPPDTRIPEVASLVDALRCKHLNKTGGDSYYVSVAVSLLQTLSYVRRFKDQSSVKIALIDLDHYLLNEPNKCTSAAECLVHLKSIGQAQWARYLGKAELMFWCDIPTASILHILRLSELEALVTNDPECARLLQLNEFKKGLRTQDLARRLQQRNLVMSRDVAKTIGRIAQVFGMDSAHIKLIHISNFVARLVDGWKIQCSQITDTNTAISYAMDFATSLNSRSPEHNLYSVMETFLDGCRQGTEAMEHFSLRRRMNTQQKAN